MDSTTPSPLPRETRDTLLVLGVVALVLLPQVAYLPPWASALAALLLGWRMWLARSGQRLPGTWLLAALLVLAVGATALQFRSIVGPEAGVVLVILLLVLKTLEMRARRDAMVIFFLGFFTLLTLFLQSQSLSMALAMLVAVWGLLVCLVNAHMPSGYPSLRQLVRTAGLLMLLGAPLMLVLFLAFPRLPPLWGLPTQASKGTTGLSNDMTVGQVAELAQNHSVALRVRFDSPDGKAPPQRLLYFRGPVLSRFDGRNWQADADGAPYALPATAQVAASGLGTAIDYEITLEAHQQRWLLTLDATLSPPDAQRRVQRTADLQWLTARPLTEVLRYRAQAHLYYAYGQQLSDFQRRQHLQLPPDLNPRTMQWAQTLRHEHGTDDTAIVQAALNHLGSGRYVYTLAPDVVPGPHTADAFWFETHNGFCEHIASAFTVLMRAAGIPARIVTGYQGGERNPVDGLWTVRQSDAHAWTEVWLPHEGWLRIDPTSAVAPSRTEQLQRLSPPTSAFGGAMDQVISPDVLRRLRANWEALNHRWNDWVLNYTPRDQSALLQRLGWTDWSIPQLAVGLSSLLALATLGAAWQRWRRRWVADPWLRLMQQVRQQLQRHGLEHADTRGLQALAAAAQAQWGDESQPLQQWLLQMEQWRYAPHGPQTPSLAQLRRAYRALIWPSPRTP